MTCNSSRLRAVLGALALCVACGKGEVLPVNPDVVVQVSAGNGQVLSVGQAAAAPLVVVVKDTTGAPLVGAVVVWNVVSGGGTIAAGGPADAAGVATATYTAGSTSGRKTILATVTAAAAPASFALTVLPGSAQRVVRTAGDGQVGITGNTVPITLKVTVIDSFGNGVPGQSVTWSVTSGTGSLLPSSSVSDSLGVAASALTLGAVGSVGVTATAGVLAGSPVTFAATSTVNVTLASEVPVPANYGQHDQFIRAGLAFLCSWNTGLQIYDVGDGRAGGSPQNPVKIGPGIATAGGEVHNAWWYWAADSTKRYVFVGQEGPGAIGSSSSGDIHVVDISNINAPVEVASYHMTNPSAGTHNFWIDETKGILYAAYYNGGVVAINITGTLSGSLSSRELWRIQPGGPGNTYVWGVMLYNGSLYATDMLSGFWQLNPNGLAILGGGNNVPERYGSDQWVANGYAYSGTWGSRGGHLGNVVKIWKLSPSGAPIAWDSIVTPGFSTVSDVEVSADGKMLLFSGEYGTAAGLYFYSLVADPGHPTFIGYYPVATNTSGVHTATFADIGGHRYVFAAKDPPTPSMIVVDVTAISP